MTRQEVIEISLKNCKREILNPKMGGQSCGLPQQKVRLVNEELNVAVEIGTHRSQLKNHELAMTIMELIIEDLIK